MKSTKTGTGEWQIFTFNNFMMKTTGVAGKAEPVWLMLFQPVFVSIYTIWYSISV